MAGQYMSLLDVRNAAIYRADLDGITDRHPTLDLNREANLSYRALRVKLANADVQTVLSQTALLTLPVVESFVGSGFAEIDWPVDAVSVHGIDVRVGGFWNKLPQGNFGQRRLGPVSSDRGDYSYADEGLAMWIVRSLPTTSAATQVAGKIMLFPVPSNGQYVIWYLPQWVDIVNDTDLFPGQESWLQWVCWDMAVKCLIRDVGPQANAQLQLCQAERAAAWGDINSNTQRLMATEPIQPQSRYGWSRSRGGRLIP